MSAVSRVRHPGKFLPVVGARHRFDDGGLSGWHSGHRHQVLPGHRGDPHILGQAAGELVAERFAVAADVFVSLAAGRAFPAGHQGVHRDLVARGHAVGQRAVGGDHGAGELVAQDGGEGDVFLLAALIDANVGAAHQRRVHSQQHVAGLKIRDRAPARSAGRWAGAARLGAESRLWLGLRGWRRWRLTCWSRLVAFLVGGIGQRTQGMGQIDLRTGGAQLVQRGRVGVVVGDQPPPRWQR